jgi:biopolymer transport protein TolR
VVSIDRGRHVFIGEAEVPIAQLEEKLKTNAKAQADKEVYLTADTDLNYGTVIEVMAAAQRAGISSVGMITDPFTPPKRR